MRRGPLRPVLVAHCHANWWAVEAIAAHPERVEALVAIEPGVPYLGISQPHWVESSKTWEAQLDDPTGWQLNNRHVYVTEHRRWIEFFFGAQLVEPHSTKQYEDAVAWALESTGEILATSEDADGPNADVVAVDSWDSGQVDARSLGGTDLAHAMGPAALLACDVRTPDLDHTTELRLQGYLRGSILHVSQRDGSPVLGAPPTLWRRVQQARQLERACRRALGRGGVPGHVTSGRSSHSDRVGPRDS